MLSDLNLKVGPLSLHKSSTVSEGHALRHLRGVHGGLFDRIDYALHAQPTA